MDKFDRIFQLHAILVSRRTAIPPEDLMAKLECSKATLHRAINALKDYLHAPVIFDTDAGGYRYAREPHGDAYELPGLWFTPHELQALAVMRRLLSDAGGGLLEEHLGPLAQRLDELMRHQRLNLGEAASRLRFPGVGGKPAGDAFKIVASATLQRRKLWIEYHARSDDRRTDRTISLSIDRIRHASLLEAGAFDVPESELDAHFATAYGIFGGKADKVAVLRFTPERARWVADEHWHPEQIGASQPDGSYELRIPYRDPRELVMDIMRHGAHVEVKEPAELRAEVRDQLRKAATQY